MHLVTADDVQAFPGMVALSAYVTRLESENAALRAMTACQCGPSRLGDFGATVRHYRVSAGWSQTTLAQRSGINQSSVSKYEAGTRQPTYAHVTALARAFALDAEQTIDLVTKAGYRRGM